MEVISFFNIMQTILIAISLMFASTQTANDLQTINQLRTESKLSYSQHLQTSANQKAQYLALHNNLDHDLLDNTPFSEMIYKQYAWSAVGENLARCFKTDDRMFAALQASEAHNRNMQHDWTHFAAARVYDEDQDCVIVVHHFAK